MFLLPPPTVYLRRSLYVKWFLAYTSPMTEPTTPKQRRPGQNGRRVTLYLPDDLIRRARHHGLDAGRSLSDLAREGLERMLATPTDEPLQPQREET